MARICIITGTRAEFGIWRPVLRAISASKKLRLQLLVTGMHLQKQFGHTIDDIAAEGIPIAARVPMYLPRDTPADSLARATAGMASAFRTLKPELVMVLGDRLEILAAANAALACQIPLAHLHGGETAPAQWDEQIRHAVTKIAHLHFPATKMAGRRILQMGESPNHVHVVGAPALDAAIQESAQWTWIDSLDTPHQPPTIPSPPYPQIVLHPGSPDEKTEYQRAKMVLQVVTKAWSHLGEKQIGAIGPNNDPGHAGILRAYREYDRWIGLHMSVPQFLFWRMMHDSHLIIGNSSAGIIEAASFGCAAINLGDRQAGRERNANVIDVPWSAGSAGIEKAIHRVLTDKKFQARVAARKNLYGDGRAAQRIVKILESLTFPLPTTKRFHHP